MKRRTRYRSKNPKLVAKKRKRGAAKRYAKKFKATPVLKRAIRTEILKDAETHSKELATRLNHNVNNAMDGIDITSIFDTPSNATGGININGNGITYGNGADNREGDTIILTSGFIYITMRANTPADPTSSYGALDMFVHVWFFTPKKFKNNTDFNLASRDALANQWLINQHGSMFKWLGTHKNAYIDRVNSGDITVHKHYVFRVHNEVGGRTSWFHNLKIPLKRKLCRFEDNQNVPTNYNPCIAVGYSYVNDEQNIANNNNTRLTYSLHTKFYWRK